MVSQGGPELPKWPPSVLPRWKISPRVSKCRHRDPPKWQPEGAKRGQLAEVVALKIPFNTSRKVVGSCVPPSMRTFFVHLNSMANGNNDFKPDLCEELWPCFCITSGTKQTTYVSCLHRKNSLHCFLLWQCLVDYYFALFSQLQFLLELWPREARPENSSIYIYIYKEGPGSR